MKKNSKTYWVKIYASGPIEIAKQVCREYCLRVGLCVTIEPSTYIYTGGEEAGYVVGLINYPRFCAEPAEILNKALELANLLLDRTAQHSVLVMDANETIWTTKREDKK